MEHAHAYQIRVHFTVIIPHHRGANLQAAMLVASSYPISISMASSALLPSLSRQGTRTT